MVANESPCIHLWCTWLVPSSTFSVVCQIFAQSPVPTCFDTSISPLPPSSMFLGLGVEHWPGNWGIWNWSSPFFLYAEMHSLLQAGYLLSYLQCFHLPWHQAESGTSSDTVFLLRFSACLLWFLTPWKTSVGSTLLMTVPLVVQESLEFTIESRMTPGLPASSSQLQDYRRAPPCLAWEYFLNKPFGPKSLAQSDSGRTWPTTPSKWYHLKVIYYLLNDVYKRATFSK